MAPALTKILKDGHGIHLSSRPSSVRMDSDGRAVCSTELESQLKSIDDDHLQKMWLNLSSFPPLDSCLPVSPLDVPTSPVLSSCLQASASQHQTVLLPSPASLLSLLSFTEGHRESQHVTSIFPGGADMFLVPEHNVQEACLLHGGTAAPEYGPDGGDVHHAPFALTTAPPFYPRGQIKHRGYTTVLMPPSTLAQGKVAGMGCPPPSPSVQPHGGRMNSDLLSSRVVLEEAVRERLSRQAALQSRAQRLQRRLRALLGEHALQHCTQQLEGLKRGSPLGGVSPDSPHSMLPGIPPAPVGYEPPVPRPDAPTASLFSTELREFSQSNQAVLRGLQEVLDSEATASSSSDEEREEDKIHSNAKTLPL